MRQLLVMALLLLGSGCMAQEQAADSLKRRPGLFRRIGHGLYEFVKEFSRIDTAYIEPQHYNYTVMLQNTNTYEYYRLSTDNGNSISLAPKPSVRLGPYVGWRWVFLGYTIDLTALNHSSKKTEFGLSLYSSQIGVDLFYRKTGNDFRIDKMSLASGIDTSPMRDVSYDGLDVSIKGFNLYYIFNHRRFSYPAAFSQSTMQKKSCGSPIVGIGYTRHTLSIDCDKLNNLVHEKLGNDVASIPLDSVLGASKVKHTDYTVMGGYAYNFAFAHNWLFAASLSLGIGYKHTESDVSRQAFSLKNFNIANLNLDGIGRFGIVWNNNRWYAGASTILHSYSYSKKQFSTNNTFGSVNIYVGWNFSKR